MTKRQFLKSVLVAGVSGLVAACKGKARAVQSSSYAGVDFKELVHKEPDPSLPIIVALHGESGAPEHWIDGWTNFPGRARVVLPRGFERAGDGYAWFAGKMELKNDDAIAAAAKRLFDGIAALAKAANQRVVVAGFDQGAVLSYALAKHPDVVLAAFPVAGAFPASLVPKEKTAPIVAYHGDKDDEVPIARARETIAAFKAAGADATLREYPGVHHGPSDKLHHDLDDDMVKALENGRRR